MARKKLTNYFFYRKRVLVAYVFVCSALLVFLLLALLTPNGLTVAEQTSSVRALNSEILGINAPYYLIQKASLLLFGLSDLSIKLPSVLLSAVVGISVFLLLRRWLSLGIAIFSALIVFSSTTFLSIAGTGSPTILYVLFPALLLFFGTRVLAHDRRLVFFSILLLLTISLALLTPTMVYLLLLALTLAVLNPHVRYGFRRLPATGLFVLAFGFLIAITPVGYLIITDQSMLPRLLGIPTSWTLGDNIVTLITLLGSFFNPGIIGSSPAPLVGLATLGLALIGLYGVVRAIYTARAQFMIGWSVIGLLLAILNPEFGILLYLPIILLAALGLSTLAAIWYKTFPLNPYARIVALVPIGILIGGIVIGSTLRYVSTTHYVAGTKVYSQDLDIIKDYVHKNYVSALTLAVPESTMDFYEGLNTKGLLGKSITAYNVTSPSNAATLQGATISSEPLNGRGAPVQILTDDRRTDADRFYVYQ